MTGVPKPELIPVDAQSNGSRSCASLRTDSYAEHYRIKYWYAKLNLARFAGFLSDLVLLWIHWYLT